MKMIFLICITLLISLTIVWVVYILRKEHKKHKKMFEEIRKRKITMKK